MKAQSVLRHVVPHVILAHHADMWGISQHISYAGAAFLRMTAQVQGSLEGNQPAKSSKLIAYSSKLAIEVLPVVALAAWCVALFYYLLERFPYDGLYGQDAYAYYYQARAILQDITGQSPQPWSLFSSSGLYHWPIGYHILLMIGQVVSGSVAGGRAITLFMAVGATIVLYLLVGEIWPSASRRARVLAGLVAGAALPLVATYTRMGLSLMADVPALFWGLLGIYCSLRAWPVPGIRDMSDSEGRSRISSGHLSSIVHRPSSVWAFVAGLALGIAVLTRYGAIFFLAPVPVYLVIRRLRSTGQSLPSSEAKGPPSAWWLALGFALGILPQIVYLVAYNQLVFGDLAVSYGGWLGGWSPANYFATTLSGPDGVSKFDQPMIAFYLLEPFYSSNAGFLSAYYLPALLLGVTALVRDRLWSVLGLLASWWLLPVLFFAGTTYQAHRFALTYLPVLLILVGIGAARAFEFGLQTIASLRAADRRRITSAVLSGALALIVLGGMVAGVYQEQGSVKGWMAIHESFKVGEQQVLSLAHKAAGTYSEQNLPRVIAFGISPALYHYTQWPIIEIFNSDEATIKHFLDAPGPHLLVVPEQSIATQWADTPLAARLQWLKQTYPVISQGTAGGFTIYTVGDRR